MTELTLETAFKLAVSMEEASIQLYTSAQDRVVNPGSKQLLKELAAEEERHRSTILEAMEDPEKVEEIGALDTVIQDLKIVDFLETTTLSKEAYYQDILIYAAKREKETHDFYLEFAKRYQESKIGSMFANLAREELRHKFRLESEYDDIILKEM